MVDDELERLANLTPEELEAEMQKSDIDEPKARSMVEKAIAAADALQAADAAKGAPAKKEEGPVAKIVSFEEAKARRTSRIVAFAIAAGVAATVGYTQRHEIVAWIAPPSPTTSPTSPLPVPTETHPTPAEQQLAATLREQAFASCARKYFPECQEKLDQAKALDPSGEELVAIRRWREAIRDAKDGGSDFVKLPSPP